MDRSQKVDWSQLSVFLSPDNETDTVGGQGNRPTIAQVKNDGSFDMKDVPAGTYRVIVGSNDQALRDYITKSVNLDGKDIADSGFTVSGGTYAVDVVLSAQGAMVSLLFAAGGDHFQRDTFPVALIEPNALAAGFVRFEVLRVAVIIFQVSQAGTM
jgi:hypothetical protein